MIPNLHLILHGVAIKKHASAADIATIAGLPQSVVTPLLASACTSGRVIDANGKFMLSPAGQLILASEYSRFCDTLRANTDFLAAYARFEQINKDLKQLITDWQTMDIGGKRVPNTHADRAYDERIIGRLSDLHDRFEPLLTRLVAGEPRLDNYRKKLNHAIEKAEDHEIAWVSDVKLDSYHTVWFELHEDLLRLLGRQRDE